MFRHRFRNDGNVCFRNGPKYNPYITCKTCTPNCLIIMGYHRVYRVSDGVSWDGGGVLELLLIRGEQYPQCQSYNNDLFISLHCNLPTHPLYLKAMKCQNNNIGCSQGV